MKLFRIVFMVAFLLAWFIQSAQQWLTGMRIGVWRKTPGLGMARRYLNPFGVKGSAFSRYPVRKWAGPIRASPARVFAS